MDGEEGGPVLVTGAAGFIGFHACRRFLDEGRAVVGVDVLDPYYDVALKEARLALIAARPGFTFERLDLAEPDATADLFARHRPSRVLHLAAQPGVRHSLVDPGSYARANLVAFLHVLEGCRHGPVRHLVFASSSSVYGRNAVPFRPGDRVDRPLNLYGATKASNELMAHAYASLFGIPTTGLRFFTVYGPWGRPDMAVFLFARAIVEGRPIELFNEGRMSRDFTYVDDVVEGIARVMDGPPSSSDTALAVPFRVFNIGSDAPVPIDRLVALLEAELGRKAVIVHRPMQPGEAEASWADIDDLGAVYGVRPTVSIEDGIRRFAAWFREFEAKDGPDALSLPGPPG